MSVEIVSLLELVNTATGVNEFLFAGEIRMALGADFDFENVGLLGGAGEERISASALNGDGVVIRMDAFFHDKLLFPDFYAHTRRFSREYDIKFLYYSTYARRVKRFDLTLHDATASRRRISVIAAP